MDPDTALANLRAALARYRVATDGGDEYGAEEAAGEAADAAEALDGWLGSGGFLPAAWRPAATR